MYLTYHCMYMYVYVYVLVRNQTLVFPSGCQNDDIEIISNDDTEISKYQLVTSPRQANPKVIKSDGPAKKKNLPA